MTKHTNTKQISLRSPVSAAALAAALLCVHMPPAVASHSSSSHALVVACPTEDSEGVDGAPCVWLAGVRGNGRGLSFTAYPDGSVLYW